MPPPVLLSRTVDLVRAEQRVRFTVDGSGIHVSGADALDVAVDSATAVDDVVRRMLRARDDAGWVVVFDEARRRWGDDEESTELKAHVRWHDVGGVRLREVNGAQLSSRYLRCVRQLELARVDADERPLWRYNTSITERASTSGPDVEFVSLADGSAGVRVTGSSTGATGHEDYDEVDVTLRLSDGQPAR